MCVRPYGQAVRHRSDHGYVAFTARPAPAVRGRRRPCGPTYGRTGPYVVRVRPWRTGRPCGPYGDVAYAYGVRDAARTGAGGVRAVRPYADGARTRHPHDRAVRDASGPCRTGPHAVRGPSGRTGRTGARAVRRIRESGRTAIGRAGVDVRHGPHGPYGVRACWGVGATGRPVPYGVDVRAYGAVAVRVRTYGRGVRGCGVRGCGVRAFPRTGVHGRPYAYGRTTRTGKSNPLGWPFKNVLVH